MAILHGSWLLQNQGSCLFVWGETWRSLSATSVSPLADVPVHPLAMTTAELIEWWRSHLVTTQSLLPAESTSVPARRTRKGGNAPDADLPTHFQVIALPTQIAENGEAGMASMYPVHSATLPSETELTHLLQPWRIEGFCLEPLTAIKFLTSLPLGNTNEESAFLGGFTLLVAGCSLEFRSAESV